MKKQRGLILGLGFVALLGLSARDAQAGNLTITLSWGVNSLVIDWTTPYAQAGSDANNLTVNTQVLNSFLATNGSAYSFTNLGGSSNNPGAANPIGATLSETGEAKLTQAGNTAITITASQNGFTAPTGVGTLNSSSSALFTNATAGDKQTSSSAVNASSTSPLVYTYTAATNPQSFSGNNTATGLSVPSGFTLSDTTTISLSAAGVGHAKNQFTTSAHLLAVVPEPASIVMMVTGMPLPLVVMGLLRRRRAAA